MIQLGVEIREAISQNKPITILRSHLFYVTNMFFTCSFLFRWFAGQNGKNGGYLPTKKGSFKNFWRLYIVNYKLNIIIQYLSNYLLLDPGLYANKKYQLNIDLKLSRKKLLLIF